MSTTFFRSLLAPIALALLLPAVAATPNTAALDKRLDEFYAARKAGDAAGARAILAELVAQGHPKGVAEQAEAHRTGEGAEKNGALALKLFEQSADARHVWSMRMIGWMHEQGDGIPADAPKAVAPYRRAAEAGDAWSGTQLGVMVWNGEGTPADGQEAMRWLHKAAQAQHAAGMNLLGRYYAAGRADVRKNADQAHFWSVRALVAGHEGAKKRLQDAGYRTPLDVMAAFNAIVQRSGGRLRVANYKDEGPNGGTFTLYSTADGSVRGNVVWMMDFGVKPSPELRTVIGARVRKTDRSDEMEGRAWRELLLLELRLVALDAAVGEWNGDLKP